MNVPRLISLCIGFVLPLCGVAATPPHSGKYGPCEASANCALRMARDAAFHHFISVRDPQGRTLALKALQWIGEQDIDTSGNALRIRFGALGTTVDKLEQGEQPKMRQLLAEALAASGLMTEATALVAKLPSRDQRDSVRNAVACAYGRRGSMQQAFAALDTIEDAGQKELDYFTVIYCVADSGKPEFADAAAKYLARPPEDPRAIPTMYAFTHWKAGNPVAARSAAQSIKNDQWRYFVLNRLAMDYMKRANYKEAVATSRMLLDEAIKSGNSLRTTSQLAFLLDAAVRVDARQDMVPLLRIVPAEQAADALPALIFDVADRDVVHELARLVAAMPPVEQQAHENVMLRARMRVGELSAREVVAQSHDPDSLSLVDGLVWEASRLGRSRQAEAREILDLAIAANHDRPDEYWVNIVFGQAWVGLLEEAHDTIRQKINDRTERGRALIGVSGAEAAEGRTGEAIRSREEGVRLLSLAGEPADNYAVAEILVAARYVDEGESELLSGMKKKLPGLEYEFFVTIASRINIYLAENGQVGRAFEFATEVSKYLDDTPAPFIDLYCKLARVDKPILL